ncbi:MAG: hypothetical protein K2N36_08745, partial [Ruminiclostridium sp.]|nr:hypothetical protein [Ruminiclostridium sp.]
QGYTSGTWQYSTYVHDYISALESIKGCELFIEGKNIDEIGQWVDIRNVYLTWNGPDTPVLMYYGGSFGEEETVPVATAPPDIIGADGIVGDNGYYERTEVPLTKEIAKQIIEECKKDIEDIKVKMKQTFEEYAQ